MPPQRRRNSMRHPTWHYGWNGYYFITICTHQRQHIFTETAYKTIAETTWYRIPTFKSATSVKIDEFIVMPNHLHGILVIENGYAPDAPRPDKTISGTISAIIAAYKAAVAKKINHTRDKAEPIWQRGYYDRIIKSEAALNRTRQYIIRNPTMWQKKRNLLPKLLGKMTFHSH